MYPLVPMLQDTWSICGIQNGSPLQQASELALDPSPLLWRIYSHLQSSMIKAVLFIKLRITVDSCGLNGTCLLSSSFLILFQVVWWFTLWQGWSIIPSQATGTGVTIPALTMQHMLWSPVHRNARSLLRLLYRGMQKHSMLMPQVAVCTWRAEEMI